MQGPLRVHTFSSGACVHAVESFDGGCSNTPHRSGATRDVKIVSGKEIKKKVTKLLSSLKQKWRASQASRRRSKEAAAGAGDESDAETFVSANNSELRSFCTDHDVDDGESELSSFGLVNPLIFPVGVLEHRDPAASPVKIVQKLPFGYVIGRQPVSPAPPQPALMLTRKFKKMMPMLADVQLRSRSRMIRKKVLGAVKERFGRGAPRGSRDGRAGEGDDGGQDGGGNGDDQDVFWKKDVRGLRCRRVEDDEPPY